MEKMDLAPGDVVQLRPEYDERFAYMLVVVTEPKSWGCQGYLMAEDATDALSYKGKAYLRPTWKDIEFVGHLPFFSEDDE